MPPTAAPSLEPTARTQSVSSSPAVACAAPLAADGNLYVTALGGEINPWMVIALHRRITTALDAGSERIVLDLSAVSGLSGQTVGVLCGVLRRLARRGATLAVAGGPVRAQLILERCPIDGVAYYRTVDDALMAVALESDQEPSPVPTSPSSAVPVPAFSQ